MTKTLYVNYSEKNEEDSFWVSFNSFLLLESSTTTIDEFLSLPCPFRIPSDRKLSKTLSHSSTPQNAIRIGANWISEIESEMYDSFAAWLNKFLACLGKSTHASASNKQTKGPYTVEKPVVSEDFWTTSTYDVDNSAAQSQRSKRLQQIAKLRYKSSDLEIFAGIASGPALRRDGLCQGGSLTDIGAWNHEAML
ncbi:hypothetical protein AKJ16_DCAP05509, partial [Drosera capensis]